MEIKDTSIREQILRLKIATDHFKKVEAEYKEQKQNANAVIKNYLEKYGKSSCMMTSKEGNIRLSLVRRRKVIFDPNKVKKAIGEEFAKEVLEREVIISDMDGMKELLKAHGVKAHEFKQLVEVRESINNKALDDLTECGWVETKSLKGTYTTEDIGEYVKMSIAKDE